MTSLEDFDLSVFPLSVAFVAEVFSFLVAASELLGGNMPLGGTGVTLFESSDELTVRSRFLRMSPSDVEEIALTTATTVRRGTQRGAGHLQLLWNVFSSFHQVTE